MSKTFNILLPCPSNSVRGSVWPSHPTSVRWCIPDPSQIEPPQVPA